MSYDAIIFDNDGVLVTPNRPDILEPAVHAAFADLGVDTPPTEQVRSLLRGVKPPWLREVCADHDIDPDQFWRRRDARFNQAQRAAIHAGEKRVYDDIDALDELAVDNALGIVSSNQHDTIEFILEYYDLRSRFETWYGREPTLDSLRKKKPAPHYLDQALADLGTDDALFVGDSESDIEAAANANVDSAYIRRPHCADTDLSIEPTMEIESLADLH